MICLTRNNFALTLMEKLFSISQDFIQTMPRLLNLNQDYLCSELLGKDSRQIVNTVGGLHHLKEKNTGWYDDEKYDTHKYSYMGVSITHVIY